MAKQHTKSAGQHSEPQKPATGSSALQEEIALRAYYRHCERGGAPGSATDDWLAAEQEVLAERPAQHPQEPDID
ncbi:MAG: DUF2934 domain-containing protein [Dehalococcoidia bacterium]|jgi:hypothetical protein